MSHSPGPWVCKLNSKNSCWYVMAEKPRFILETSWNNMEQDNFPDRETAEANAKLAAKSPEMHDRLERIRTAFQALRDGREHASSALYRVLAAEFPLSEGEKP